MDCLRGGRIYLHKPCVQIFCTRFCGELVQAFTAYISRVITAQRGIMLPTAPRNMYILLVAFAIGLLVPAVIIFMKENMNTKVRGRKDLENLSIPFIGEIPQYLSA